MLLTCTAAMLDSPSHRRRRRGWGAKPPSFQSCDLVKNRFTRIALGEIIRTMCETFNGAPVTKTLLGEVHKLLRLYLTLSVASMTSERTFFALRQLKNYLRSTTKQDRLNCVLMHYHKSLTDTLDTVKIATEFCLCQRFTQRTFWEM